MHIAIGDPTSATLENDLLSTDTTGYGSAAALGMMLADHFLNHYASDLGVTLDTPQIPSDAGAPDVMDIINTFGMIPFGGTGSPPTTSPQYNDGSLVIGGETLTLTGTSTNLLYDPSVSLQVLTASGVSQSLSAAGVDVLVDVGGGNTISAGSSSQAVLVSDGNSSVLEGGSGQNTLIELGNDGTIIGGSGSNQIILDSGGITGGSGFVTVISNAGTIDLEGNTTLPYDVSIQGYVNTIYAGTGTSTLNVVGSANDIVTGSGNTTVELDGYAAVANFVIGGSGTLDVDSSAVATWVIGGTGTVNYTQDAPAITLIGGSGTINAQIVSDGASIATAGGVSNISLQGEGGQVVTGSGYSSITYSGDGGMFYQGDPTGYAVFNLSGTGVSVAGGNVVSMSGQGDEVLPWGAVPSYVEFPIGGNTSSDMTLASAISDTGSPINLDGSVASFDGENPTGPRTITFSVDEGTVMTGDQPSSVTVNGTYNTLEGGAGDDTINVASGTGNWIIASGGNNTYIDATGSSELDYTSAPNPAYVDLGAGVASNGFGGTDTLSGITWVDAGSGSTLLAGNVNARLEIDGDGGTLYGGTGSDSLTANGNGNTFYAGAGSHQISANGTGDLYVLTPSQNGTGTVEINQSAPGVTGTIQFTSGIGPSNLWFSQDSSGNLVATVLGTNSSVTVDGWFNDGGSSSQLSQIMTDAASLDNSQINGLEAAMASYQSSNPSFTPSSATGMPSDPSLESAISTLWQNN